MCPPDSPDVVMSDVLVSTQVELSSHVSMSRVSMMEKLLATVEPDKYLLLGGSQGGEGRVGRQGRARVGCCRGGGGMRGLLQREEGGGGR